MARNFWRVGVLALGALAGWPSFAGATPGPVDGSETPAHFQAAEDGFDFARREAMIPMRDGVKLHTVILVPNGAAHAPILLTRTPYNADELTSHVPSATPGVGAAGLRQRDRCDRARPAISASCRTSAASTGRRAITS